ncbi:MULTISPECIES: leucine-rich repeat domain-containing protein [unclassified Mameliella]|uniref:leucine-rich repeat domain-containing protein n=1 Tax=unclassified Mameliella TaxID=2630630 RepID=UPI00273E4FAF|nr:MULTISPECIES: leucine-rich repeat domain-containing protein [unclassified Mameliella]
MEDEERLQELWLDGTAVTDLSPLARCRGLRQLSIRRTGVTDLSPLKGLPKLAVLDLRPILGLPALCEGEGEVGISFEDTPAALRDRALARIAETEDSEVRASDLVDHLTGGARLTGWRGDA